MRQTIATITEPDRERVQALAANLITKGIHESLAPQVAHDILVLHPAGGAVRVQDGVIEVTPRSKTAR